MKKVTDLDLAKKYMSLYTSATTRNIEFDLSLKKLKQLMSRKTCAITGVEFTSNGLHYKSIDRVDNSKGYIDSNVIACTVRINSAKADLSIKEIKQLYKLITKFNL